LILDWTGISPDLNFFGRRGLKYNMGYLKVFFPGMIDDFD